MNFPPVLAREIQQYLDEGSTIIYLSIDQVWAGYLVLSDTIRIESEQMIEQFKGNPLVGIVVLEEDVRSSTSKLFANLDN